MTYIYPEGDQYVFMNQTTGDQIHVPGESIGDEKRFLIDGLEVEVTLFNGNPIGVEPPGARRDSGRVERARHQGRHRERREQARHAVDRRHDQRAALHQRGRVDQGGHANRGVFWSA